MACTCTCKNLLVLAIAFSAFELKYNKHNFCRIKITDCVRFFDEQITLFLFKTNACIEHILVIVLWLKYRMAKFLVDEKGANPNLRWKSFPYTLIAQAMPYQYEPDEDIIR